MKKPFQKDFISIISFMREKNNYKMPTLQPSFNLPKIYLRTKIKNVTLGDMKLEHQCSLNISYPTYTIKKCNFEIDSGEIILKSSGS